MAFLEPLVAPLIEGAASEGAAGAAEGGAAESGGGGRGLMSHFSSGQGESRGSDGGGGGGGGTYAPETNPVFN